MKRKICFVTENAMGGIPMAIKGIMECVNRENFDFHVVLLDYSWRPVSDASKLFDTICKVSVYHFDSITNKYDILKRIHEECYSKADLIVAAMQYDVLANFVGNVPRPIILMVHGDTDYEKKVVQDFYDVIDHFVPISEKIYRSIQNWIPGTNKNTYLPHALPEFELPFVDPFSDNFTVLFVGRFNDVKGADLLLEIGQYLRQEDASINYVLITDGVGEEQFKKKWVNNSHTKYYNNISNEEVQKMMVVCNVLVMPSRSEGLPVVLIEAFRRGLVPIVSDLQGGIQEVVEDGVNGFCFPFSETKRFASKILHLKKDRKLLAALSDQGKKGMDEKFNSKKNGAAYEALFLRTLAENNKEKRKVDVAHYLGILDRKYIPNFITVCVRRGIFLVKNFKIKMSF